MCKSCFLTIWCHFSKWKMTNISPPFMPIKKFIRRRLNYWKSYVITSSLRPSSTPPWFHSNNIFSIFIILIRKSSVRPTVVTTQVSRDPSVRSKNKILYPHSFQSRTSEFVILDFRSGLPSYVSPCCHNAKMKTCIIFFYIFNKSNLNFVRIKIKLEQ